MNLGKSVRLERIFNRNTGKTIIVPLDHGTTVGPIAGLVDMRDTINKVAEGGANAVLMHKGLPRCSHRGKGRDVGLIIHLSASTTLSPFPNAKTLVATVEDGLRLGADAVSVHLNLGDETERDMLRDVGEVSSRAESWGMPLLAMVYARGPKVKSEWDPATVAHCARVAEELGADVVKVPYTGDPESFSRVTEACCIPVVIAGGPKMGSVREILQTAHDSLKAGGSGLSMGRNIFQAEDPTRLVQALHAVVHLDYDVDQALALMHTPSA
ncbi:2-amino-3,7-dideoxy-D-threo-hept-6-ulosonate synthase [Thermodesulfomicrobium sp. WS]|uniref:2-amino-3,7-dideoxy-D-threo-hept-6-ulosonate synthase n=1 Tax=Thermodesulfomicrobium sp. WS TaxID=3004129 RepID=UPI00248F7E56|nr:2-amino-3,7-dideoxy-D-threo-hept-6-ulosonate synthase [Thermodesulfomicrobium sp. WS]BDU99931.1 2-amino-3,7-dideoxy-D-threo-hept-6-ulosonate synthase [Thermodesulfomicrobium sp. WS]